MLISRKNISLIVFCSISLSFTLLSKKQKLPAQQQIEILTEQFLNIEKYPEKTYKEFAHELITLLPEIPGSELFRLKMEKLKDSRNAMLVGLTFLQYRSLFSPQLVQQVIALGKNKLIAIFNYRINAQTARLR